MSLRTVLVMASSTVGPVLPKGEPAAGPWREVSVAELLVRLEVPAGRPRIVAVDGRGGSGKSTLAARLAAAVERGVVVHTDDVAWHHSFFDWTGLLVDGVLNPARDGRAVRFRPPAWDERRRPGAIEVPAGTRWLFVEGVGASRRELADLLDAALWVQSDHQVAEQRGIDRDVEQGVNGDREQATAFWHEWEAEELPFLRDQRPWERVDAVVAGVGLPQPAADHVLLAPAPGA